MTPYGAPARHPHEIAVIGFSVFVGVMGLVLSSIGVSKSIQTIFPDGWQYVYFILLILAGVVTLVGIFNPKIDGPLQERVGLLVLTTLFVAYAMAVIVVAGFAGLTAATFALCYSGANIARCIQISRAINDWRAHG